MSKYTTEVRFICEQMAGRDESVPYTSLTAVINAARLKIFDFPYPIFDTEYKPVLETKILKHFYTREIGEETVGLWRLRLNETMNRIMPYYNKLYESELIEFNPLYDVDITRDGTREGESSDSTSRTGTSSNSSTTTVDQDTTNTSSQVIDQDSTTAENQLHWDLMSDTPQGGISRVDNNSYLTEARKNTAADTGTGTMDQTTTQNGSGTNDVETQVTGSGRTTDTGTASGTTAEEYLEHVKGKQGSASYSKMLEEFRKTFLRIDDMILEELEPLFMQLW